MIERQAVDSSNIDEVGYDSESSVLEILFKNGSVYQYYDVPEATFHELLSAGSVGQYFHRQIRGIYRYSRV